MNIDPAANVTLYLNRPITGSTQPYGFLNAGVVQSDATLNVWYNRTFVSTQAATFTLSNLYHYAAAQSTFGVGSTVGAQIGFAAEATLIGATTNYGFWGNIPAGTNRWNIYMNGTANNYMAGNLGIGSTGVTNINLRLARAITGSANSFAFYLDGAVQSDVSNVTYVQTVATTAASVTLTSLQHYSAFQTTLGAGSSIATQTGYVVEANMIGATTNTYGFRGRIPAASGRYNIYMDGTALNYTAGGFGIGDSVNLTSGGPILTITLTDGGSGYVDGTYTDVAVTGVNTVGLRALVTLTVSGGIVTNAVLTWGGIAYRVGDTFTVSNTLLGGTGSGLVITVASIESSLLNMSGTDGADINLYRSDTTIIAGESMGSIKFSNNDASTKASGVQAKIAAYASGAGGGGYMSFFTSIASGGALTEAVRIAETGAVGIGATSLTGYTLRLSKAISGNIGPIALYIDGVIGSSATSSAAYFYSNAGTEAASFTLPTLTHYIANQSTFGVGSTVTTQIGFDVRSTLIGAGTNIAYRGQIPSGINRWNLYMNGTANNYIAGRTLFGTLTDDTTSIIQANGTVSALKYGNLGPSSFTAFTADGQMQIYTSSTTTGLVLAGRGSVNDLAFVNKNGDTFFRNPTGTTNITVAGQIASSATTASTSTTTGALVSAGGLGVAGAGYFGSTVTAPNYVTNTFNSTVSFGIRLGTTGTIDISLTALAAGGWARGLHFITNTTEVIQAGLGIFGADASAQRMYWSFGSGPWSNTGIYLSTQNNVGIGISSIGASSSKVTISAGTGAQLEIINSANSKSWRPVVSDSDFAIIETGVNTQFIIKAGGNIGIGTTTPASRLTVQGTTATDSGQLGAELLTTGTGDASWTGSSFATGYTHVAGSTTTLTSTLAAVVSTSYQITYTVTGRTAGSFRIDFGGFGLAGIAATGNVGTRATTTGTLVITPTSDFNGTIVLSIRALTTSSTALLSLLTSTGGISTHIRANNQSQNTLMGVNAGSFTTTAITTTAFGHSALSNMLTGQQNVAVGNNALLSIDNSVENTAIGAGALSNILSPSLGNTAVGARAGRIFGGTTNLTLATNSVFIGTESQPNANNQSNQIVIGAYASGLGSNTSVIGTASTVMAAIRGRLLLGTTTDNGTDMLQVTGTIAATGNITTSTGSLGIGTTALTGYNLRVNKNITGGLTSYNISAQGPVLSDVTTAAFGFYNFAQTAAESFTLTSYIHYQAEQGTFGVGSTVNSQFGFRVHSSLIGATNNYGFSGDIPAGTNRWNLYMAGTAANYLAGSLGIGSTTLTGYNLRIGKTITGATTAYGISQLGTVQSDVTSAAFGNYNLLQTQAASFTLPVYYHYYISQAALGAGSSITNQYGFIVDNSLTGATNNYGFYGNIPAGTGDWNLYMNGTASNYIAGNLGIGSTALTGYSLRVSRSITGSGNSVGIGSEGQIQSDVTTRAFMFYSAPATQATTFTTNINHFTADQGSFGAGSTVAEQNGFSVTAAMIGATNNFAFRGGLAAGTGRWNLYMSGTASNYIAGELLMGTTTSVASSILTLASTTQGFLPPRMTKAQREAISSPATGLVVYQTDDVEGLWIRTSSAWRALTMV